MTINEDPEAVTDQISFDRLVTDTLAQIVSKPRLAKLGIDERMVQETLSNYRVAERLRSDNVPSPAKRLLLRRVVIRGNKRPSEVAESGAFVYDRVLKPGLNGWISGNNTGKSTILKCISWALTGVSPSLKRDVQEWIDEVALELSIDQAIYTIRYFVRTGKPRVFGQIYENTLGTVAEGSESLRTVGEFVDTPAMKVEIARFFGTRLGFNSLDWAQQKKNAFDVSRSVISWNVFSQALVVSADDCGDYLFPSSSYLTAHHESTLSTYLGLGMEEAIAKLQADLTEANSHKGFEKRRLEVNAEGVHERLQQLQIEEDQVTARIKRYDAGQSVLVDTKYISVVREQIAMAMNKVVELTEVEHVLLEEEQTLRQELTGTQRACRQLEEAKQFRVYLSGINVERCPHCEQAITLVPVNVELQNGHCHVCKNQLTISSANEQLEAMLKTERARETKLTADMRALKQDIRNVGKDRTAAEAQLETLRAEMKDLPRQERVGYDTEIRGLLNRQGFLKGQIENLREHTTQRAREKLQRLQIEETILSATLDQLRGTVAARNRQVLNRLDTRTTELTLSFGLSGVDMVGVNAQFNLYVHQDERNMRFNKMELSERLRLKIAFHLAMLALRASDGVGRHPGVLIVDAPGGAEMDELRFGEILLGFKEIKEELGDQVQILIVSTREELEQICPTESLERKGENEFLF